MIGEAKADEGHFRQCGAAPDGAMEGQGGFDRHLQSPGVRSDPLNTEAREKAAVRTCVGRSLKIAGQARLIAANIAKLLL